VGGSIQERKDPYMFSSEFGWRRKFTSNYGTQTLCLPASWGTRSEATGLNRCIFNHLEVRNPLFF
jgi:hypothetical protein